MNWFTAVVLGAASVATTARAQALPGLGADRVVGTAGIETVAPGGLLGLPVNPAAIAADRRWSVALGSSTGPVTDLVERSVTASIWIARLGLAGRITSRWVKDLFEDPALSGGSHLRVESDEYAVGASLEAFDGIRVGFATFVASTKVLSSTGNGFGYRMGVDAAFPWIRAGVTYGDAEAAMDWQSPNGVLMRTGGTKRLSVGASTPTFRLLAFEPAVAFEWNIDAGFNKASWLRGSVSLGALHGALRAIAGWAECTTQEASSYREVGVIADIDRFQLQLGVRLGADPVPGNSLTLGIGVHNK